MAVKNKLEQIFQMSEETLIPVRLKLSKQIEYKVSNPMICFDDILYDIEMIELLGFVDTYNYFESKRRENLPNFYREFMKDLIEWVDERDDYDFDDLAESIKYYADEVIGKEKNTMIGLIHHLVFVARSTEFNTMNQNARYQMYLLAYIELKLELWGKK